MDNLTLARRVVLSAGIEDPGYVQLLVRSACQILSAGLILGVLQYEDGLKMIGLPMEERPWANIIDVEGALPVIPVCKHEKIGLDACSTHLAPFWAELRGDG